MQSRSGAGMVGRMLRVDKSVNGKSHANGFDHAPGQTTSARPQVPVLPAAKTKAFLAPNGATAGVIRANAVDALMSLPSDTFNVAITSPPYYWVRDYG